MTMDPQKKRYSGLNEWTHIGTMVVDLREWMPYADAAKQLPSHRAGDEVYRNLLEMMAIPAKRDRRDPSITFVRRTWVKECRDIIDRGVPWPRHLGTPIWNGVCMPLEGWRAFYALREAAGSLAWTLEHGIQEVFAVDAGSRETHLVTGTKHHVAQAESFRTTHILTTSCLQLLVVDYQGREKMLLTQNPAIVTCKECLACEVERILA